MITWITLKYSALGVDASIACALQEKGHLLLLWETLVTSKTNTMLMHLQTVVFLLLFFLPAIVALSAAALSGYRRGFAYFAKDDLSSDYLQALTLEPWDHWIQVGWYEVRTSYLSEALWSILGPLWPWKRLLENCFSCYLVALSYCRAACYASM